LILLAVYIYIYQEAYPVWILYMSVSDAVFNLNCVFWPTHVFESLHLFLVQVIPPRCFRKLKVTITNKTCVCFAKDIFNKRIVYLVPSITISSLLLQLMVAAKLWI